MLMPKKVKFRKQQRGTLKGNATRGNYVAFGEYGLQILDTGWLTARQIEAGRIAAQHLSARATSAERGFRAVERRRSGPIL